MRICLKLCQRENLAEFDVLLFKLCALLLGTEMLPPSQPSLLQKVNSEAALSLNLSFTG